MKKIIVLLLIVINLNVYGQKKDTVPGRPQFDTAYVFNAADIQSLIDIVMSSNININGKPATGKELNQLIDWMLRHGKIFKKEQPK